MTAQARITSLAPAKKRRKKRPKKHRDPVPKDHGAVVFGINMINARVAVGATRVEFAKEIGLSYSNTANIETGQNWPSMPVYIKICSALGIGVPPLVG